MPRVFAFSLLAVASEVYFQIDPNYDTNGLRKLKSYSAIRTTGTITNISSAFWNKTRQMSCRKNALVHMLISKCSRIFVI